MNPVEPVKPTSARAWTANDMLRATTKRLTRPATIATSRPAMQRVLDERIAEQMDQLVDHSCAPYRLREVVRFVDVEAGAACLADHDDAAAHPQHLHRSVVQVRHRLGGEDLVGAAGGPAAVDDEDDAIGVAEDRVDVVGDEHDRAALRGATSSPISSVISCW